ncbi:MAG: UbiA family prenyltransferase [Microbacteriaceae bacterium]|nr:UbiA family prenyltransferase [Microbacteriaceae bacterium]
MVNNKLPRGTRLRGFIAATHFPQALAMVLLMTIATAFCGGSWSSITLVFLASAAGQATVGWTNDVHDAEADRAAGRDTKPTVSGDVRPDDLRVPILVSATLTIPLSFMAAGWIGGAAHLAAVASALVYNFFLARTVWSWVPYAVSFALMPVFIAQASSPSLWSTLPVTLLSVLVGITAHLLNAIPDIDIDRETGWGGLAVSLGQRRSMALAAVLVVVGVVCLGVLINDLLTG